MKYFTVTIASQYGNLTESVYADCYEVVDGRLRFINNGVCICEYSARGWVKVQG